MIPDEAVDAAKAAFDETNGGLFEDDYAYSVARKILEAAAPHLMADHGRLTRSYYRSITPDGELWCESSDPEEVREMSEGKECTFQVANVYEIDSGWQEWPTNV